MQKFLWKGGLVVGLGALGYWLYQCYGRSDGTLATMVDEMRIDLHKAKRKTRHLAMNLKEAYEDRVVYGRHGGQLSTLGGIVEVVKAFR